MRPLIRTALFIALPLIAAATPLRELTQYQRDPSHSIIGFSASSRMIDADGTWDSWTADIKFDPENINASKLAIVIDAKTVNTRVERRDNHLRSKDFFFVDSFPTITFTSVTINAPSGPSKEPEMADTKMIITGDLAIRGITKRISIPSTLVFYDAKANRGRVKGTFTVLRKDYNVGYDPPGNPVRNEVEMKFDVSFVMPPKGR